MSDGYLHVSVVTTPESLAHDIVFCLEPDQIIQLIQEIDSAMHDWSFTTNLINTLKEAIP